MVNELFINASARGCVNGYGFDWVDGVTGHVESVENSWGGVFVRETVTEDCHYSTGRNEVGSSGKEIL